MSKKYSSLYNCTNLKKYFGTKNIPSIIIKFLKMISGISKTTVDECKKKKKGWQHYYRQWGGNINLEWS